MSNNYFKFKQFIVYQDKTAMKVGVDSVLLGSWVRCENVKEILDIGTGTGLLSLMLAQKTSANITAVEIDENACRQAIENIEKSKWDNIRVIQASIQDFASDNNQKFDLIICNPPYFSKSLKSNNLQRNIARHDNRLPINELFESVENLLSDNGKFYMIYPYSRKEYIFETAKMFNLYPTNILAIKGNEKKDANRCAIEFVNNNLPANNPKIAAKESVLIVRNSSTNEYSEEYKNLTKDYYIR